MIVRSGRPGVGAILQPGTYGTAGSAAPAAPTLVSPADAASAASPVTLSWTPDGTQTAYAIRRVLL